MEYNHLDVEAKWQKYWAENKTFAAEENSPQPKYYGLTMFPYPSGAGLHVGHPLGYIASCIYARYKRLNGFNVLHPMGYDSFGLPAEQYAIQTGQHPGITTEQNINRYREQLDKLGFSFDWDREVKTSDPAYYRWTQWIFKELYNSWYDNTEEKAKSINDLIRAFEGNGNTQINASTDYQEIFSADDWNGWDEAKKQSILMKYRLAYLADSWVNWCPALGTVLANDEIKDGVSERGGHPVEQKLMRQWIMRITAYAKRLLNDLETLHWTDSLKEMQRNWIGKSVGASVHFDVKNHDQKIEVFTTRPDTIFGVSFMVLAPENELVDQITTDEYKDAVQAYKEQASLKTERDRQSDVKNITGQFTGAYALHPFTGAEIPVWIGDYVLAGYGTGAVMSVPCGDQRDYDFAKHFNIPIPNIFEGVDISEEAYAEKDATICESDFLTGLSYKEAVERAIQEIEKLGRGKKKINFRLRDAVFSRQRYWGEPFPIYYKGETPYAIENEHLPLILPEVDKYLPTEAGDPPLGNSDDWSWDTATHTVVSNSQQNDSDTFRLELNTMPGWAGSSWYFLRYMDPHNEEAFAAREKVDYWNQVDLYIGGTEHATGHLLYARFWNQFLFDRGYIGFKEPFKKMINQGMILGRSNFIYRDKESGKFISFDKRKEYMCARMNVDINMVHNDILDTEAFRKWRPEFENAEFVLNDKGEYLCGHEVEKMSKSKYNVQTPDELVEKYGADTVRCYEMFLGPLEQSKPWDTSGINGVSNFLRKFWRLFHDQDGTFNVVDAEGSSDSMKTLHKTIKKITEDLERYSFNTAVSNFMIAVNELTEQKCKSKVVLEQLTVLLSPYAPHICEEMWQKLGNNTSITKAEWPVFNEEYLIESSFDYPVSFNGKTRFRIELSLDMSPADVEKEVLAHEQAVKYLEGKTPKKVIVVPGRIVNVVL